VVKLFETVCKLDDLSSKKVVAKVLW
jgi:hypothetical protein